MIKFVSIVVLSISLTTLICAAAPLISVGQNLKLKVAPTYRVQEIQIDLPKVSQSSDLVQTNDDFQNQTNVDGHINPTETNQTDEDDDEDYDPEDEAQGIDDDDQEEDYDNDMSIQPTTESDYDDDDDDDDDWIQDFQIYTEEKKIDAIQVNIF